MTVSPPPFTRLDADALLRSGHTGEAIDILRALSDSAPEEESHLFALAWALHDSGRRDEAVSCFERLFAKELSRQLFTGFAYDELVRIYREEGQWDQLLAVCQKAVAAQPEDTGLLRTLGEALLASGNPGPAATLFEQLISREPDQTAYWCALGEARLAEGNSAQAIDAYEQAAMIDPAAAPAFFHRLAVRLRESGHLNEARVNLSRCLALQPQEPLYRAAWGDLLLHAGEIERAWEAYAAAAILQPSMAGDFWNRLGQRLQALGLFPQAIEAFRKAAAADPGQTLYLLKLASLYADQGMADDALEALCAAQRRNGDLEG